MRLLVCSALAWTCAVSLSFGQGVGSKTLLTDSFDDGVVAGGANYNLNANLANRQTGSLAPIPLDDNISTSPWAVVLDEKDGNAGPNPAGDDALMCYGATSGGDMAWFDYNFTNELETEKLVFSVEASVMQAQQILEITVGPGGALAGVSEGTVGAILRSTGAYSVYDGLALAASGSITPATWTEVQIVLDGRGSGLVMDVIIGGSTVLSGHTVATTITTAHYGFGGAQAGPQNHHAFNNASVTAPQLPVVVPPLSHLLTDSFDDGVVAGDPNYNYNANLANRQTGSLAPVQLMSNREVDKQFAVILGEQDGNGGPNAPGDDALLCYAATLDGDMAWFDYDFTNELETGKLVFSVEASVMQANQVLEITVGPGGALAGVSEGSVGIILLSSGAYEVYDGLAKVATGSITPATWTEVTIILDGTGAGLVMDVIIGGATALNGHTVATTITTAQYGFVAGHAIPGPQNHHAFNNAVVGVAVKAGTLILLR